MCHIHQTKKSGHAFMLCNIPVYLIINPGLQIYFKSILSYRTDRSLLFYLALVVLKSDLQLTYRSAKTIESNILIALSYQYE